MPDSGRWQKAERGEPAVGTPAAHEAVTTMLQVGSPGCHHRSFYASFVTHHDAKMGG